MKYAPLLCSGHIPTLPVPRACIAARWWRRRRALLQYQWTSLGCSTSQTKAGSRCLLEWISHGRDCREHWWRDTASQQMTAGIPRLFLPEKLTHILRRTLQQGTGSSGPAAEKCSRRHRCPPNKHKHTKGLLLHTRAAQLLVWKHWNNLQKDKRLSLLCAHCLLFIEASAQKTEVAGGKQGNYSEGC